MIQNMGALSRVSGKTEPIPGSDTGGKQSTEKITAPLMFSSKPGKTAYLTYITPEEMEALRNAGQGHSEMGRGPVVDAGKRQHMGPLRIPSFDGEGGGPSDPMGGDDPANNDIGDQADVSDPFGGAMGGSGAPGNDGPNSDDSAYERYIREQAQARTPTPQEVAATRDSILRTMYGLHPDADPNAFMFGMQGYYTPSSYADAAIMNRQGIGADGPYAGPMGRYMDNYMMASGAMAPGRAPAMEQVQVPDWFMPGGEAPGRWAPDYSPEAIHRLHRNQDIVMQDEDLVNALNPDVAADPVAGANPVGALRHYLQYGRNEGRDFGGQIPGRILGFARGGAVQGALGGGQQMGMGPGMGGAGPMPVMSRRPAPAQPLPLMAPSTHGIVDGSGNGTSDDVPVMASRDEYIIPAHAVAAMGNGSTSAGAEVLDNMVMNATNQHMGALSSYPGPRR
jgi:hypothetical protein